jgi:hypothetical protein
VVRVVTGALLVRVGLALFLTRVVREEEMMGLLMVRMVVEG